MSNGNGIRRRTTAHATEAQNQMLNFSEFQLSSSALMATSPIHSGKALKLHSPVLYSFLPSFVQRIISTRCFPKSWSPQWNLRHLIALGSYLYKFKDENASSPKGAPISVLTAQARLITREDTSEVNILIEFLPPECDSVIEIISGTKTQYFAVESREEAQTWVNTLRQMRQDSITRNMGHSKDLPYPRKWESFDASAKKLIEKKARIKDRLEAMSRKEQEMQNFGATSNFGYYS